MKRPATGRKGLEPLDLPRLRQGRQSLQVDEPGVADLAAIEVHLILRSWREMLVNLGFSH